MSRASASMFTNCDLHHILISRDIANVLPLGIVGVYRNNAFRLYCSAIEFGRVNVPGISGIPYLFLRHPLESERCCPCALITR